MLILPTSSATHYLLLHLRPSLHNNVPFCFQSPFASGCTYRCQTSGGAVFLHTVYGCQSMIICECRETSRLETLSVIFPFQALQPTFLLKTKDRWFHPKKKTWGKWPWKLLLSFLVKVSAKWLNVNVNVDINVILSDKNEGWERSLSTVCVTCRTSCM